MNDHYNIEETRKEQEKLKKELQVARVCNTYRNISPVQGGSLSTYTNTSNTTTNTTNTTTGSAINTTTTTNANRKVRLEHQVPTTSLLLALSADHHIHIRPLCTSSDVLLALYELLDPTIFLYGCIQLPHILPDGFNKHVNGFYRYIYQLNQPGIWQYIQ